MPVEPGRARHGVAARETVANATEVEETTAPESSISFDEEAIIGYTPTRRDNGMSICDGQVMDVGRPPQPSGHRPSYGLLMVPNGIVEVDQFMRPEIGLPHPDEQAMAVYGPGRPKENRPTSEFSRVLDPFSTVVNEAARPSSQALVPARFASGSSIVPDALATVFSSGTASSRALVPWSAGSLQRAQMSSLLESAPSRYLAGRLRPAAFRDGPSMD
jgi:hypothetical protein